MSISPSKIIYIAIIAGESALLAFMLLLHHTGCVGNQGACFAYRDGWKLATPSSTITTLTKAKPGAIIQLSVADTKIAGNINAVAGQINSDLQSKLTQYHLISAGQVSINGIRSIELVYQFAGSTSGRVAQERLVIVPVGSKTYFFTAETSPDSYQTVNADVDYTLQRMEIKK